VTAVRVIRRLEDLLDVDGKGMSDCTTLVYRDDTAKHEYETVAGVGDSSLTDLTDVTGTPGTGKSPVSDGAGDFPLTHIVTQTDLDGILASVAAVNWRPLDLQPGFAAYGNGFADPRYRLTLNNVVHVEGMVLCNPPLTDDDAGKVIATVADDSLPGAKLLFGCAAYGNNARIDVMPTGEFVFYGMLMGGGQIDWFSLSVINYSVGAA